MIVKHTDVSHQGDDERRARLARIDAFYDWIYRRGLARLAARGSLTHMRHPPLPRQESDRSEPR
jgi:hypothetical protein